MRPTSALYPWPKQEGLGLFYGGIGLLGVVALGLSDVPVMIFWIGLVMIVIYVSHVISFQNPFQDREIYLGVQDDRWCLMIDGQRYDARLKPSSVRLSWVLALEIEVQGLGGRNRTLSLCATRQALGRERFTHLSRLVTVMS
jgi:hypothetical protein